MTDDRKHKHLELIQGVVNRLSTNSFLLKGWSVVLISALFALSAAESRGAFVFLAYIPAFVFWGLDGYFLWQERLYRKLYNHVRKLEDADIDYSMDTTDFRKGDDTSWLSSALSSTIIVFHGVLILAIVTVMILDMTAK